MSEPQPRTQALITTPTCVWDVPMVQQASRLNAVLFFVQVIMFHKANVVAQRRLARTSGRPRDGVSERCCSAACASCRYAPQRLGPRISLYIAHICVSMLTSLRTSCPLLTPLYIPPPRACNTCCLAIATM